MTRLQSTDISGVATGLNGYDQRLQVATGHTLLDLAVLAAGLDPLVVIERIEQARVTCVPSTSGHGRISGFDTALAGIAAHLGFNARITTKTDVDGLANAYQSGADIILTADDHRFVAINTRTQQVVDNADATGRGFAYGLDRLAGGVKDKCVLVVGCGPVGISAALTLLSLGASLELFDIDRARCRESWDRLKGRLNNRISRPTSLKAALGKNDLIIDATPSENLIGRDDITPVTFISAPGVPCGVKPEARQILGRRLLHDPLQIGVATMLLLAIKQTQSYKSL